MSKTMTYTDTVQRLGYTVIDGVKVLQHTCTLKPAEPEKMRVSSIQLNKELYKANLDICRADIAEFEDSCFELQKQYLKEE